jgi:ABC-type nitrate/sulfonate/bicarbonate transport system substrate-binding protein
MKVLLSIIILLTLAFESPRKSEAASVGLTRIRVGYPSPSASFFPLFATKEAELFEKYGFDAEMIYVQGIQLVQVHVAGQLDFSSISAVVALPAALEGADLSLIASSIEVMNQKLMVNSAITRPADLKGKTIAITRLGSLTDILVRPVLKRWGLEPQKDVKLIQIGRMPDIATAISQRSVDGGVISFPTSVHAEKIGIKTLFDFAESGVDLPTTMVAVSRRYSNAHRETVLRFLKAYIEGSHRLMTDRELGIRALRRYGGTNDQELLTYTYNLFTSRYIKKVPTLSIKSVENALNLIAESNSKAKGRKAEEFVDPSFMDELEKTGFIKTIGR